MSLYTLKTTAPPIISLAHHTFTFRIYRHDPGQPAPLLTPIGHLTFQKPPQETWPDARARFTAAVYAWLASYEDAQAIDAGVNAWLQTQEWHTP